MRLILADHTFDEVHHSDRFCIRACARKLKRPVRCTLNVDRQSLFHDRPSCSEGPALWELAFSVRGSGPQGLRRPRFSFFRFTCQTARNLAAPSSQSLLRQDPETRKPAHPTRRREHGHEEHGRMLGHRVNSEGLRRRAIAQAAARQRGLYSIRYPALSTIRWPRKPLWTAIIAAVSAGSGARAGWRDFIGQIRGQVLLPGLIRRLGHSGSAALRPHSSAVLCYKVTGVAEGTATAPLSLGPREAGSR